MYSSMAKGTSQTEVTSNSKKIKPVALAIVKIRLSKGIRQLISQWKIPFFKFYIKFLKAFQVDLKSFLGLCYT